MEGELDRNGHIVRHDKNPVNKIAEIYKGHEVAAHTLTHPNLTYVKDDSVLLLLYSKIQLFYTALLSNIIHLFHKTKNPQGCGF